MMRICTLFAAALFMIGGSSLAQADIIFDNSGAAVTDADLITPIGPLYASFSTGDDGGDLDELAVVLLRDDLQSTGTIDIGLFADSSTSPGAELFALGQISDSELTSSPSLFNISVPAGILLASDTRYWIGLSNDDPQNPTAGAWTYSTDTSGIGVASESYDNSLPEGVTANTQDGGYQMQVGVAPEPATTTTILLGLGLLIPLLRLRSRTEPHQ